MINLSGVTKRYGDRVLYENASFLVRDQDKIGLVGPNGAGKSTIFRIITGRDHVDVGSVSIESGIVVGYFDQNVGEMAGISALAECMTGVERVSAIATQLAQMEDRMGRLGEEPMEDSKLEKFMEEFGDLQHEFQVRGGYDLESRAQTILTGLGIGPDRYNDPVESFSGGWKMRIALAKILLLNPDALLMDEPTNHLDIESILWLEKWLQEFKGSIVMTSHDREFMNRVCSRTIEIANKTIATYSGNYEFYLKERELRREQQVAAFNRQQEMLSKEEDFIARFAARASHAAQVQSRVKKLDKIERVELPVDAKKIDFEFSTPPRSGNIVVKLENLGMQYPLPSGGVHPVFSGISGVVQRLNKVAVTGVNGAGKSTLLKVIAGLVSPTQGDAQLGASLNLGYFSQHSADVLSPEKTVWQEISDRIPHASVGVLRSLLGAFMFSGDDVEKKVRVLSGGEKSRLMLATILAQPVNFLILDEPTNHLDIDSRETLLKALQKFEGTIMIVSHDRYFLQGLINRVFEIDHGQMRIYDGDYAYYKAESPLGR